MMQEKLDKILSQCKDKESLSFVDRALDDLLDNMIERIDLMIRIHTILTNHSTKFKNHTFNAVLDRLKESPWSINSALDKKYMLIINAPTYSDSRVYFMDEDQLIKCQNDFQHDEIMVFNFRHSLDPMIPKLITSRYF